MLNSDPKIPLYAARVTVVIPVHNRAKTIKYCLKSILEQTVLPDEIIVVDDCSTDDTVEIVNAIGDPRIRCVRLTRNSGAQAARNRGIQEARSQWIAFQDSDDEWVPGKLKLQLDALYRVNFDPFTVVHTNCWQYDANRRTNKRCNISLVDGDKPFRKMLFSSGPMLQGLLTSKDALQKINLLDESVPSYQEWDTFIRLAKECRFLHIKEPLFIYHIHDGETISKDKLRDITGYQYIVDKFRDDILEQCGSKVLTDHLVFNAIKAICWRYHPDASEILKKSSGNSLRIQLLNWMASHKINIPYSDRVIGIFQLIHQTINLH